VLFTTLKQQFKEKLKAYVMLIIGIILDQKSSKYFTRKTHSKVTRHLCGADPLGGQGVEGWPKDPSREWLIK
jgi:hypothetical protein